MAEFRGLENIFKNILSRVRRFCIQMFRKIVEFLILGKSSRVCDLICKCERRTRDV